MNDTIILRGKAPKDTHAGHEWEEEHQASVSTSVTLPADCGEALLLTAADDGGLLDAIVSLTGPTFPGCPIRTRPIDVPWAVDADHDERGDMVVRVRIGDPARSMRTCGRPSQTTTAGASSDGHRRPEGGSTR